MTDKKYACSSTCKAEIARLLKENERMRSSLCIIHTWASCDLKYGKDYPGQPPLLDPVDVMDQCNQGLGYEEKTDE